MLHFLNPPVPVDPDADKLIIYHNPTGAATFDPTITLSQAGTVIWETEVGRTVTTGTNHALSYTPTAGPKICKVTVVGGLSSISGINVDNDAITKVRNLTKCGVLTISNYTNPSNRIDLAEIQHCLSIDGYFRGWIGSVPLATGIAIEAPIPDILIYGDVADYSRFLTKIYLSSNTVIQGPVSDLPHTALNIRIYACAAITAASIAHLIAIRDLRIYSMGWNQAGVDTVISSAWSARAAYTYSSISLQIGGTNAAPSGNKVAPVEGSDWHEDTPGHWIPLTANAMVYDLLNDVNSEGFKKWFSISTS